MSAIGRSMLSTPSKSFVTSTRLRKHSLKQKG